MSHIVVGSAAQLTTAAHQLYVKSLYRRSLRLAADWYWERPVLREKCLLIRAQFDRHAGLGKPAQVESVLRGAEVLLDRYAHPQPYKRPVSPGSSKWERNIPVPEEIIDQGVTPFDNDYNK